MFSVSFLLIIVLTFHGFVFKANGKSIGDLTPSNNLTSIETGVTDDRYLLTNMEIPINGIITELEFYVTKPGGIFINLAKVKSCAGLLNETCAQFMSRNYNTLNIVKGLELQSVHPGWIKFDQGVAKISPQTTTYATKGSFFTIDQYFGAQLAVDTSGKALFSDYSIDNYMQINNYNGIPFDTSYSYFKRLDQDVNYKFYFTASILPFTPEETNVKHIGGSIPDNIPLESSTASTIFLDFILFETQFQEESVVTGIEIVLNENPVYNRIGKPIEIGYLEFDDCKTNQNITNCIQFVQNQPGPVKMTYDQTKFIYLYELKNGYNNVTLPSSLIVPKGSFLILRDNPFAIAVDKMINESMITNFQVNLTKNLDTQKESSSGVLTKPNWNYYIKASYYPLNKSQTIKFGSLPQSNELAMLTSVTVQHFLLTSIEIEQDSSIHGYEFYASSAGLINLGVYKHSKCEQKCADYLLNISGISEQIIQIKDEKWLQVNQGYNNITFSPIYVPKGSFIILRQNNTGRIAVDKTGRSLRSDMVIDCRPKCLTPHKLNPNSNWRFFFRINLHNLRANVSYGEPVPNFIDQSVMKTINRTVTWSKTPNSGFFFLHNIQFKEDAFIDKIEFYAQNSGQISIGFITPSQKLDELKTFNYTSYWNNGIGSFPDFITTHYFDARPGFNRYAIGAPRIYKKNTFLYLYQHDAMVSIDTSGNSGVSDYVVDGHMFYSTFPEYQTTYNVKRLHLNENWRFFMRIGVKEIDYFDNDTEVVSSEEDAITTTLSPKPLSLIEKLIILLIKLLQSILGLLKN